MPPFAAALSRRALLSGLVAAPALAAAPGLLSPARAAPADAVRPDAEMILVALADLHSAYDSLPRVVHAVKAVRRAAGRRPMAVLINGDIFDRADAVALRSAGMVDWAAIGALASVAPLAINLGDQEVALRDDLATVVAGAKWIGAQVIGNVVDARNGGFYAPISARMNLGGRSLGLLGLAPSDRDLWRETPRRHIALLDPVSFAGSAALAAFAGVDAAVALSHAGLAADKQILPQMPKGAVVIGGHDHLSLTESSDGRLLVHPGAFGESIAVINLSFGPEGARAEAVTVPLPGGMEEDRAIGAVVQAARLAYMPGPAQDEIGTIRKSMTRSESAGFAAEGVRRRLGVDLALIEHVAIGPTLREGPLLRYHLDKFIRRDGRMLIAEIPGERLRPMLSRLNQHEAQGLAQRSGDYLHGEAPTPEEEPSASHSPRDA